MKGFKARFILILITAAALLVTSTTGQGRECWIDTDNRPVTQYCPASGKNYQEADRSPNQISYIVIHTVQGSLNSAVNTFQSGKLDYPRSAHYTIGKEGEVIKSVQPQAIAWHAGTSPVGSGKRFESHILNANSIGIEHAGFVDDPDFPTLKQYITSAALVRLLCAQYKIPIDREHIIGHSQIKSTKGDPGANWDWDFYIELIRYGSLSIPAGIYGTPTERKAGISPQAWSRTVIAGAAFATFLSLVLLAPLWS